MAYCTCGCGEAIPPQHLFRYKQPYLLRGHKLETPLCACGCGERTPWSPNLRYQNRKGFVKGHDKRIPVEPQPCACGCRRLASAGRGVERRYISGHNSYGMKRGEGRYVNNFGYVLLRMPDHPDAVGGYVREHRYVMEQVLDRELRKNEHVHHINGDKTDNRPANLAIYSRSEHGKLHGRGHSYFRPTA